MAALIGISMRISYAWMGSSGGAGWVGAWAVGRRDGGGAPNAEIVKGWSHPMIAVIH